MYLTPYNILASLIPYFSNFLEPVWTILDVTLPFMLGTLFVEGVLPLVFQAGEPVEMIKLLGDWKSDAVLLY